MRCHNKFVRCQKKMNINIDYNWFEDFYRSDYHLHDNLSSLVEGLPNKHANYMVLKLIYFQSFKV